VSDDPAQFYTGLVAHAYAPLRGSATPVEPYLRFVQRFGTPALEIGCGHGEPLLDLIEAGCDVTGLDSSADMLALCMADAERRGLSVAVVCQSMESMALGREFSSIYFAGPTFQLVVDLAGAAHTLRGIAHHLTADGRVLVPLFVPSKLDDRAIGVWKEHVTDSDVLLAFRTVRQSYRPVDRRVDTVLEYRQGPEDSPQELLQRMWSLRWYEDGEFEALASQAGLTVESVRDHGSGGRSVILRRTNVSV
jgi:SAM-dependent methyltransferase